MGLMALPPVPHSKTQCRASTVMESILLVYNIGEASFHTLHYTVPTSVLDIVH